MPSFRKGAAAAAEASKGAQFARTNFFKLEDGESIILRFITPADEWITVQQHQMIPTKDAPKGYKGDQWPERMGAVCRRDEAFSGLYDDCYICDFLVDGNKIRKPGARVWALACIREEVIGDGSEDLGGPAMKGKVVGYKDGTREETRKVDDKEVTQTVKNIVVVNMGWRNFFSVLDGFAARYGTITDRDYWIKRVGSTTDTTYQIVPANEPIAVNVNGEAVTLDPTNPVFADRYKTDINLEEIITERSNDEFYARFFDRRMTITDEGKVESSGVEVPAKPENEVDEDMLKSITQRVKSYKAEMPADEDGSEGVAVEGEREASASAGAAVDLG